MTRSRNHYVTSEKTGKTILNQNVRAGHFSEKNNADIVAVAKGTGTRRHELANLKGSDFKVKEDGSLQVTITGKGGKSRTSEVIGNTQRIRELAEAAGESRLFEKVPAKMDVHYYRAQYAQELYDKYARQIESVPRAERYDCRGDMAGTSFDKKAMEIVSENLGHERIDVIAGSYLWK